MGKNLEDKRHEKVNKIETDQAKESEVRGSPGSQTEKGAKDMQI